MNILLQNFRCFSGKKNKIPIRPLTILVGENSTGKTSLMAAISILSNTQTYPLKPSFNSPPFALGSYETIALQRSKGKPADYFAIGFEKNDEKSKALAKYVEEKGHVKLKTFSLTSDVGMLNVSLEKDRLHVNGELRKREGEGVVYRFKGTTEIEEATGYDLRVYLNIPIVGAVFSGLAKSGSKGKKTERRKSVEDIKKELTSLRKSVEHVKSKATNLKNMLEEFGNFLNTMTLFDGSPVVIAPIRSKPQRTYDTYDEKFDPEGKHIPLRLARLFESKRSKRFRDVLKALKAFGSESGLYKGVRIKKLGAKPSLAFEVIVQIGNHEMNLVDVGYGVSQSLPIVVQAVMSPINRTILLQQPEVHLHPKAQAALGSLFLELVRSSSKKFIIETHSDYLIDRIRREVSDGMVDPELVQILYFEKRGVRANVYQIRLDKRGNIRGAPKSYRSFFLEEEMKLLSRGRK